MLNLKEKAKKLKLILRPVNPSSETPKKLLCKFPNLFEVPEFQFYKFETKIHFINLESLKKVANSIFVSKIRYGLQLLGKVRLTNDQSGRLCTLIWTGY